MALISSSDSQSSPSSLPIPVISASFPPKNLWWILGGLALTSTCGYLGYRLYKRKLDNVRNLILEFQDEKSIIHLLNEIWICYTSFYIPELKRNRKIRRRYPRQSDEYVKAVDDFQLKLRKAIEDSIDGVLKKYNLTERDIDFCLKNLRMNNEIVKAFDNLLEALYMGRRRFDLHLAKRKRRTLETCRKLEPESNAEEIAVVQARIEDDMFEYVGCEKEQVEALFDEIDVGIKEALNQAAASEVEEFVSRDLYDRDSK
jgi:hypothetical protein